MKRIILFIFIITITAGFTACNVDESPQMETSKTTLPIFQSQLEEKTIELTDGEEYSLQVAMI